MLVLVQWARGAASGWEPIDSADWQALPSKSSRGDGPPALDGERGWVNALCCQGVLFHGDRYAIEHLEDGCAIWTAYDDPRSGFGEREAVFRRVRFRTLAPDAALYGAINTRNDQSVYTDDDALRARVAERTTFDVRARASLPAAAIWRHGVSMPDALYRAHLEVQSRPSWREWIDGVAPELVAGGRVLTQRRLGLFAPAKGTRTYYAATTALANGIHAADAEVALTLAPAGVGTIQSPAISTNGQIVLTAVSPANEPNHAQWPTGTYRHQIDVLAVNSDVTFGLLQTGPQGSGHFARVDAAIATELETKVQTQAAFTLTGLKLATTGSVSWAAGSATDRFELAIAAEKSTGMGTSTITLELGETDDFADGPWTAAAAAQDAIFFGANF